MRGKKRIVRCRVEAMSTCSCLDTSVLSTSESSVAANCCCRCDCWCCCCCCPLRLLPLRLAAAAVLDRCPVLPGRPCAEPAAPAAVGSAAAAPSVRLLAGLGDASEAGAAAAAAAAPACLWGGKCCCASRSLSGTPHLETKPHQTYACAAASQPAVRSMPATSMHAMSGCTMICSRSSCSRCCFCCCSSLCKDAAAVLQAADS